MLKSILEMEMTRVVVWGDRHKEAQTWHYYLGENLRLTVEVKDDLPTGQFTFYYKGGTTAIKGHFDRGDRAGESEYFLPTGELLDEAMEKEISEHFDPLPRKNIDTKFLH
jgi:antitoxin component YwqK of YwqJK toxin-antitoxin module